MTHTSSHQHERQWIFTWSCFIRITQYWHCYEKINMHRTFFVSFSRYSSVCFFSSKNEMRIHFYCFLSCVVIILICFYHRTQMLNVMKTMSGFQTTVISNKAQIKLSLKIIRFTSVSIIIQIETKFNSINIIRNSLGDNHFNLISI